MSSKLRIVHTDELEVDPDVQILFTFKPKLVAEIVANFNEDELGVIDVVPRNNGKAGYWVIDGRHRLAAVKQVGQLQMRVDDHGPMTKPEKARLKLAKDQRRRTVTALEHFLVEVKAEDPDALTIKKIVEDAGYEVGKLRGYQPYTRIEAVATLYRIYRVRDGEDRLRQTLVLNTVWTDEPKANGSYWLSGLAEFVRRGYADNLSPRRYARLKAVVPAKVIAQCVGEATAFGGATTGAGIAPLIAERLRKTLRLPRWRPPAADDEG